MKNIIFPTDFSKESINAFDYALAYARKIKANIIIFHAFSGELTGDNLEVYSAEEVERFRKEKDSFGPFEQLKKEKGAESVNLLYVVKEGDFMEIFRKFLSENKDELDLVVMGTDNNRDTFKEFFVGPNTIKVMESVNKPIMAVPEKARFDGTLDNILFLIDYREDEKAPLQDLIERSRTFDSKIHVVHIDLANVDDITNRMEMFKNSLKEYNYDKVIFESVRGLDINDAVQKYCEENQIDVVYLMNYKMNFFRRLFTHNIAEELVKHLDTPVMSIYK